MTTITVTKSSLVQALKVCHMFAALDSNPAVLNGVHLTGTTDGRVILQATDRYKLAASPLRLRAERGTVDADPEIVKGYAMALSDMGGVIISRPRVTLILQWLAGQDPSMRRVDYGVEVKLIGGAVRFSGLGLGVLEVPTVEGEYPKLEQLMDMERWADKSHDDYTSRAAFGPVHLEVLGKASRLFGNNPVEVALGKSTGKPVLFRVTPGDESMYTYMLLMPVRLPQYDA